MTAVIYARYSSDNQREESIEGQIWECTAYAEKNGITVVKHYIDRAISVNLSEKVIRGMTENALKCKFSGGAIPFGYVINADRRYIGELKYRDILIPDAIPPIVSVELFSDVQEKMLKNKKAPARRKAEDDYLLTIKLFCGYCGALMFGESGTSRKGEVHRYYKCATAKKHKGGKKKTVRKQWLEDLVVNQTMQLVKDDAAMESIIAKVMELQNKENTNIALYEKQLRDAESGIQDALNVTMAQQTELNYLIYNDPLGYADLILNGDPEEYLRNVTGSHGLED